MNTESAILDALQHGVSAPIARSIVGRAKEVLGVQTLDAVDVGTLVTHLESALGVFVEPRQQQALRTRIESTVQVAPRCESMRVEVAQRRDVAAARTAVRMICGELACDPLARRRAVMVVSELGDNIVEHSTGGSLELIADAAAGTLEVIARDGGPGMEATRQLRAPLDAPRGGGLAVVRAASRELELESHGTGTTVRALVDIAAPQRAS